MKPQPRHVGSISADILPLQNADGSMGETSLVLSISMTLKMIVMMSTYSLLKYELKTVPLNAYAEKAQMSS